MHTVSQSEKKAAIEHTLYCTFYSDQLSLTPSPEQACMKIT